MQTLEPGIYHGIDADLYHSDPCVNPSLSSSIAAMIIQKSAYHAKLAHPRLNPAFTPNNDRKFDLGTAAHNLILEKGDKLCEIEFNDYRKQAAKDERDASIERGEIPLLTKDMNKVEAMDKAFWNFINNSELAGVMDEGNPETTLIWNEQGVHCRARLDWWNPEKKIVIDYKTTKNAEPLYFIDKIIPKMLYDMKAAFYLRGLKACGVQEKHEFIWIVQEDEAPYLCSLIGLDTDLRETGRNKAEYAIQIWKQSIESNSWHSYGSRIHWAKPVNWAEYQFLDKVMSQPVKGE